MGDNKRLSGLKPVVCIRVAPSLKAGVIKLLPVSTMPELFRFLIFYYYQIARMIERKESSVYAPFTERFSYTIKYRYALPALWAQAVPSRIF